MYTENINREWTKIQHKPMLELFVYFLALSSTYSGVKFQCLMFSHVQDHFLFISSRQQNERMQKYETIVSSIIRDVEIKSKNLIAS